MQVLFNKKLAVDHLANCKPHAIKIIMALKIKGFSSVLGGFLIHLTLGTFYTIGNMNTYITSYLRKHGEKDLTYSSAIWINTGFFVGMGKYNHFNYELN